MKNKIKIFIDNVFPKYSLYRIRIFLITFVSFRIYVFHYPFFGGSDAFYIADIIGFFIVFFIFSNTSKKIVLPDSKFLRHLPLLYFVSIYLMEIILQMYDVPFRALVTMEKFKLYCIIFPLAIVLGFKNGERKNFRINKKKVSCGII